MLNGRRIAVLTSGGDAPGMHAAIRAVVRADSARATRLWQGLFANQVCLSLPEKVA
jgi:6-phosphofructokinase